MTEFSWLDSVTEDQAFDLVLYFERKFDWSIPSIWTRADVESLTSDFGGTQLTDEQWKSICGSHLWRKGLGATTEDQAMLISDLVVDNVLRGNKKEKDSNKD